MPLQNYSLPETRPGQDALLTERQFLQSVVEIARNVCDAAAASIFLIDAGSGDLVFEAVAGEGGAHLPGTRFPGGTGIAGWVAASGEPMYVGDLSNSTQFARDAAVSTGYVPEKLMAAPLIRGVTCIGVVEVLDPSPNPRGELSDLDLLGLVAIQAAIGLEMLISAQRAHEAGLAGDVDPLRQIRDLLTTADPADAALATTLLEAAAEVLTGGRRGA
ncbi:MAG TPA: GAF domain-containing protein [Streptosporangiaceae bacterium]|jgi:GAF domain-containing protein